MSKRQLVQENLHSGVMLIGTEDEVIQQIKDLFSKHKSTHSDLRLIIESYSHHESLELIGSRLETDEEYEKRLKKAQTAKELKLKQLARLQAEIDEIDGEGI